MESQSSYRTATQSDMGEERTTPSILVLSSSKVPKAQGKYLTHKLSSSSYDCIASVSTQLG